MIISHSARVRGVAEEPWDLFVQGQTVTIEGYPGNFPESQVLQRARSRIGAGYHLLIWNCEHLVAYAHGLKPESRQVTATVAIAIVGAILAAR